MSFFSLGKKTKSDSNKCSLVFNISSCTVTGAIISFTAEPGVKVIYYTKNSLQKVSTSKLADRLLALKNSVQNVAADLQLHGPKSLKIDQAFYIFSSPWSVSQTKTLNIREGKPFKVTADYIKKAVETYEAKFQAETPVQGTVVEKKIVQLKLNGYVVDEVKNQVVNELDISLFSTIISNDVLRTVEEAVAHTFIVKNNWCHSLTLPVYSVIRDFYPHHNDFIYIDMSDDMTDLIVVRDGIISCEGSFPDGRNNFISELAINQKVTPVIAESMINMHQAKNTDHSATLQLNQATSTAVQAWVNKVSDLCRKFSENVYLPETLFLIANHSLTPLLLPKLTNQGYDVFLITKQKFSLPSNENDILFKVVLMFLDKLYKI